MFCPHLIYTPPLLHSTHGTLFHRYSLFYLWWKGKEKEQIKKIDLLKIDCEGAEYSVLKGISDEHWPLIKTLVVEVHDIDHRLDKIKQMLKEKGFSKLHHEREIGLEDSVMFNLFALR